jgi:succinate dehydrogenase / fumarate reductase cytochrome b subunit
VPGPLGRLYGSTVGKKAVMAVTGVVLVVFVVGHVLGNLLVFRGPDAINGYSALLKRNALLLWGGRALLLAAFGLHVHAAWTLTRLARAARPGRYATVEYRAATLAARSLRVGGAVLLAFVVYHLLHFTIGSAHPSFDPADVYGNVVRGFRSPGVVAFYLVAMLALAFHLRHGVWSVFHTLGWSGPRLDRNRRLVALVLAAAVPLGFAAIPVAVVLGLVR